MEERAGRRELRLARAEQRQKQRTAQLEADARLSKPLAPAVRFRPSDKCDADDSESTRPVLAVVLGCGTLAANHLYPFSLGAARFALSGCVGIRVVGVLASWLARNERGEAIAERILEYDGLHEEFIERECLETSCVCINFAFLLGFEDQSSRRLVRTEIEAVSRVAAELEAGGVCVLNPPQVAERLCDDKYWLLRYLPRALQHLVPVSVLVSFKPGPRTALSDAELRVLTSALFEDNLPKSNVVLKPRVGTCGRHARVVELGAIGDGAAASMLGSAALNLVNVLAAAQSQHAGKGGGLPERHYTDVICCRFCGDVCVLSQDERPSPVVFRAYVAGGRDVTFSCLRSRSRVPPSKIVAAESAVADRVGQTLRSLVAVSPSRSSEQSPSVCRVSVTPSDLRSLEDCARAVAQAVGIPLVGIDFVCSAPSQKGPRGLIWAAIEVNARPSSLIMGEVLTVSENSWNFRAKPAIGPAFWLHVQDMHYHRTHPLIPRLSAPTISADTTAISLRQWLDALQTIQMRNYVNALLHRWRGSTSLQSVVTDRIHALRELLRGALQVGGFARELPVAIVCGPGRERLFGGHTDFGGLGGSTVNCASSLELCAALQCVPATSIAQPAGAVVISNANSELFPRYVVDFSEVEAVSHDVERRYGTRVWDPACWQSYIQGVLAFVLSARCEHAELFRDAFAGLRLQGLCVVAHFASIGLNALPEGGGLSSSGALTGTFVAGLCSLLSPLASLELPPAEFRACSNGKLSAALQTLANSDYGEYFLGKKAGAADKTAVLMSSTGRAVCIGSHPERLVATVPLPPAAVLVVMTATSPVPRLSTSTGLAWLLQRYPEKQHRNGSDSGKARRVFEWANETMQVFSSAAYCAALDTLKSNLAKRLSQETEHEEDRWMLQLLAEALGAFEDQGNASAPLLRELCRGGVLESLIAQDAVHFSACMSRDDLAVARSAVVLRGLKLLPRIGVLAVGGRQIEFPLRAVLCYGVAEVDRVAQYVCCLDEMNDAAGHRQGDRVRALLSLVRTAHDGDRAVFDYRTEELSSWGRECESKCELRLADEDLDELVERHVLMQELPGQFRRSIPDIDEIADELEIRFGWHVAARVAAAGLGGSVCVHAAADVASAVMGFLDSRGWRVRVVVPGPSLEVLRPLRAGGFEPLDGLT